MYHVCTEVARRLADAGFRPQSSTEAWETSPGGWYVKRDGAIIAYRIPERGSQLRFKIVGTHTDSPGFKLKPRPQHSASGWSQAGMEVYGAPLLNSWLDREFGLAGRVVLDTDQRLVATDAWLRIPQLAPHLDRTINDSLVLDRQRHLMPVYGVGDGRDIMTAVAEVAGCDVDEIRGHDLFAHVTQPPAVFGVDKQFLAASRLDNLSSVYPGLVALLNAEPHEAIPVLACFNHEEVGSVTLSGASGTFLDEVLERICLGLGLDQDEAYRVRARSWMVSADAGHSFHPNYPEMYDPDQPPIMGKGPMVKVNAQQRYTSNGLGEALWASASERADVPYQVFVSNNSVSCGTTIGPLSAVRLGIPTLDVGIPILSMHSAREMCAQIDVGYLARVLSVFFSD